MLAGRDISMLISHVQARRKQQIFCDNKHKTNTQTNCLIINHIQCLVKQRTSNNDQTKAVQRMKTLFITFLTFTLVLHAFVGLFFFVFCLFCLFVVLCSAEWQTVMILFSIDTYFRRCWTVLASITVSFSNWLRWRSI